MVETREGAEDFQSAMDGDRSEREMRAELRQGNDGAALAELEDASFRSEECHG